MAYAVADDVIRRGGRALAGVDSDSTPTVAGITEFIAEVEGEINGIIAGRGLTAPTLDATAIAALASPSIDGALCRAIEARYPGGGSDVEPLYQACAERYSRALMALSDGTHAAIVALENADAGGDVDTARAGSLWSDNPGYVPSPLDGTTTHNSNLEPAVYRGMHL